MLRFYESHYTGGNSTTLISEEDAITYQKQRATEKNPAWTYKDDHDALLDFMAIHYAERVP